LISGFIDFFSEQTKKWNEKSAWNDSNPDPAA